MNLLSQQQYRHFVPLSELSADNFNEIASKIKVQKIPARSLLSIQSEIENSNYYLLSGELEITASDGNRHIISANTDQSRFPLQVNKVEKSNYLSKTEVEYFKVDNNLLDILLTWDQNKSYIVNEIGESNVDEDNTDWMTQLLQLEIFHKIPPANIQAMFQKIESVQVKKDDVIIKQDDKGDYYYIIQSGSCRVLRKGKETGFKEIEIAKLEAGSGFGEDALVTDAVRNATVVMSSDGCLMRLAKKDFIELLKEPIIKSVDIDQAKQMVRDGAVWIDVRSIREHKNHSIPGSINIPLFLLRLNAKKLSVKRKYIIYCDTGSRSASATYILNEKGYDAFILEGGLNSCSNVQQENTA